MRLEEKNVFFRSTEEFELHQIHWNIFVAINISQRESSEPSILKNECQTFIVSLCSVRQQTAALSLQWAGAPGMITWKVTGWRERRRISFTSSLRTWKRWEHNVLTFCIDQLFCIWKHLKKHTFIYSPRILSVKWSASWGTWTCQSLMRSSGKLWSLRPLRAWRRTRWPTTPASHLLFLINPSPPSWEKVHHSQN